MPPPRSYQSLVEELETYDEGVEFLIRFRSGAHSIPIITLASFEHSPNLLFTALELARVCGKDVMIATKE